MTKSRLLLVRLAIIMFIIFNGCAANHMALSKGQAQIDLNKKSIALLSVKTANQFAPTYQFDLVGAVICPASEDCSNPRPYLYKANDAYQHEKNVFNEYLLSVALKPGSYRISSLVTVYQSLWSTAGGYAPLDANFNIQSDTVIYLGHVDVVLRQRKNDTENRAGREQVTPGPLMPVELKDKSIVGYTGGTFDILIEDKFDTDMNAFISEYPALQNVTVNKAILPQWKRPEK